LRLKHRRFAADRTRVTGSAHLRGIVIAGVLAAVALALGFVTLAMNQTASHAAPPKIIPLHLRHHAVARTTAGAKTAKVVKKKTHVVRIDPNFTAALKAGLPRSVARALAAHPVAVVQLTSRTDDLAKLAFGEAKVGATLAGAGFVPVDVDGNGGDVEVLTRLLGKLPVAPATLVYIRPATLYITLPGFNDRTVVQQAAANATAPSTTATPGTAAAATPAPATTTTTPAVATTTTTAAVTG
jgi:hypothetical protein